MNTLVDPVPVLHQVLEAIPMISRLRPKRPHLEGRRGALVVRQVVRNLPASASLPMMMRKKGQLSLSLLSDVPLLNLVNA